MTPADWKIVEEELANAWGAAELEVDGYSVRLEVRRVGKLRYEIVPFINGWSKGEWLVNDCEERRRFMRPVKVRLWTPAQRAKLTKGLSKRTIRRFLPGIDKTLTAYHCTWRSFGPLKRHLIANNKSIELKKATAP